MSHIWRSVLLVFAISVVLLIGAIGLTVWWSPQGMPDQVGSVVVFGDSITVGDKSSEPDRAWADLVAHRLGAALDNEGVRGTVLQSGADASGRPRTDNGISRYRTALFGPHKREMVIVAYGVNDARYVAAPKTLNVENYKLALSSLIDDLLLGGYQRDRVVLVTPYWISDFGLTKGSAGFAGQTRSGYEAYVNAARSVAVEHAVYLADTYTAMLANGGEALLNSDGIHPVDAGHKVVADAVLRATRHR